MHLECAQRPVRLRDGGAADKRSRLDRIDRDRRKSLNLHVAGETQGGFLTTATDNVNFLVVR